MPRKFSKQKRGGGVGKRSSTSSKNPPTPDNGTKKTVGNSRPGNFSRKRKRGGKASILKTAVSKRERELIDKQRQLDKMTARLGEIEVELKQCVGPTKILTFKRLTKEEVVVRTKLHDLSSGTTEKKMHSMMADIARLEQDVQRVKASRKKRKIVEIEHGGLLYPPSGNGGLFDRMRQCDIDSYQELRSNRNRIAAMTGESIVSRDNEIDTCTKCKVTRQMVREASQSVCPTCGDTRSFDNNNAESKELEKDTLDQPSQPTKQDHIKKFMFQGARGTPSATPELHEKLTLEYKKTHFHDPSKVKYVRTGEILKKTKEIPRSVKHFSERLTHELTGVAVPEYSWEELNKLLFQRSLLQFSRGSDSSGKQPKALGNRTFMRQFGRANGMENSRLYPHAKTNKLHQHKIRVLEVACQEQKDKLRHSESLSWDLKPST